MSVVETWSHLSSPQGIQENQRMSLPVLELPLRGKTGQIAASASTFGSAALSMSTRARRNCDRVAIDVEYQNAGVVQIHSRERQTEYPARA